METTIWSGYSAFASQFVLYSYPRGMGWLYIFLSDFRNTIQETGWAGMVAEALEGKVKIYDSFDFDSSSTFWINVNQSKI